MHTVRVNLGPRSYDVAVTTADAGFAPFVRAARPRATSALVVTDANAAPLAEPLAEALRAAGLAVATACVPPGERTKSLHHVAGLYDRLADMPADRQTLVVAVGGGVVGDLAGFAAATYNRGLPLVAVPTTLLAMVDSSVGGKTGVNHARGKNLIGAFHQPAGVWIDTAHLSTLPGREYRSGLAEVVKYGGILDEPFFAWLEANADALLDRRADAVEYVVARSCRIKADVVERDEREETGQRLALNFGHTFAHAFEAVAGYGAWLHGEAVAAGMVCAARLAERHGRCDAAVGDRIESLLNRLKLPTKPAAGWDAGELLESMARDKKAEAGRLRFVLPTRIGEAVAADDVPEGLVRAVLVPA